MAGLGVVGDRLGTGSSEAAVVDSGSSAGGGLKHFVTRPDLTPPVVNVSRSGLANDGDYTFMNAPWTGESPGGSVIRDARGDLVWMGLNTSAHHRMDINAQTYRGKPVLTWWEGALTAAGFGLGVGMIADTSYRTTHVVRAHRGLQVDLHEFNLTSQGTALITAYRKSRRRPVGRRRTGPRLPAVRRRPGDRHRVGRAALRVGQPGPRAAH